MDEVASNDGDGAVGEADRDLFKVVEGHECGYLYYQRLLSALRGLTYRKLPFRVADAHRAKASRHVRLLDQLVECPDLEHRIATHVLLLPVSERLEYSGGIIAYRHSNQQTRPLNLPHVRHAAGLVRLEPPHHLPALAHNADDAILRPKKETVGAGADAGDVVALEELLGVLVREGDLGDFEEVKRLPLRGSADARWRIGM